MESKLEGDAVVKLDKQSHRAGWMILAALVIAEAIVVLLKKAGVVGGYMFVQPAAFHLLALGYAVVWALFPWLQRLPRVASLACAVGITLIVGAAGSAFFEGANMNGLLAIMAPYGLVTFLGLPAAVWACRRKFTAWRFLPLLYVSMVVMFALAMSVFMALTPLYEGGYSTELFTGDHWFLRSVLVSGPFGGLMIGSLLYFVLAPFALLLFCSPYHRGRFSRILALQTAADN